MSVSLVTYAYLKIGGQTPPSQLRSVSSEVETYLEGHVDDLLERADRAQSTTATFRHSLAEELFAHLRSGTPDEFLTAARKLTEQLHEKMDKRSKPGFFVALRRTKENHEPQAAVLKLDIHENPGATARRAPKGGRRLEVVQDLLDLRGELQKGAVYPAPAPDAHLVVGDKITTKTALYFLNALTAQQFADPASACKVFLAAVRSVNSNKVDLVSDVLSQLQGPTTPKKFLADYPNLLTQNEQGQVIAKIGDQTRPINTMDPTIRPPKVEIVADGITVLGPLEGTDGRVKWYPANVGWCIEITAQQKPQRRLKYS